MARRPCTPWEPWDLHHICFWPDTTNFAHAGNNASQGQQTARVASYDISLFVQDDETNEVDPVQYDNSTEISDQIEALVTKKAMPVLSELTQSDAIKCRNVPNDLFP